MKNIFITIGSIVCILLYSCSTGSGTSQEQYQTKIDSLETARVSFFEASQMPPKDLVKESIKTYESFVNDYPDHANSGEYLFEAAKRSEIDLQDFEGAIRLYKRVYDNYENYKSHKMALFHIANAYHSMNDTTNAIANFELFIEKYPDHDFADDAQGMINFSRMGEEAFFKNVIQKTPKKDSITG